jgi:ATP synthase F1 gamma subunit
MSGKLRLYKEKLEGYKKFYSIVKTIKQVTLAKYRQATPRVATRDYTLRYTEKCFGGNAIEEEEVIKAATGTLLYIPVTTNRGSCGALNSNIYKYLDTVTSSKTKFLCIGKKANDSVSKLFPQEYLYTMINDMKQAMHFAYASYIVENVQLVPNVERVQVVFSRYLSAGVQRQATYTLLPYDKWSEKMNNTGASDEKGNKGFVNAFLNLDADLQKDYYDFQSTLLVLNAVSENELSEYAARIIAVEGQLQNIQSLQYKTQYLFNKTRQGSITASLIEIISAMNAMQGNAAKGVQKEAFWGTAGQKA